jgi:hypothetical protein
LGIALGRIKLSDELREAVWHPLAYDIVVHGAKLVADPGLDLGVEPALLAGCGILGLYFFHDLIHASPRVKLLNYQEISLASEAVAASVRKPNANSPEKFLTRGTFIAVGRNQAYQGNPGHPVSTLTQEIRWSGDVPITARC